MDYHNPLGNHELDKQIIFLWDDRSSFEHYSFADDLLVGGLEHLYIFFISIGNVIIPTVTISSIIFQRGRVGLNHQRLMMPFAYQ